MRKLVSAAAALALGASLLTGGAALAKENITSGGSSFAGTIMTTCAAAYTKHSVTYTPSSSGTGRANFTAGSINFAGSDATYSATDAKPSKFTYVPVVGGPVTVVYNVAGLATLNLTPTVLGRFSRARSPLGTTHRSRSTTQRLTFQTRRSTWFTAPQSRVQPRT